MAQDVDGMRGGNIEYIPDRLIADPVVFRGMTDSEVVTIMVMGVIFWVPVSILALLPFGYGLFGVAVGVGLAICSLILAGKRLQRIKMKQPDGLHVVHFKKGLQRRGFKNFGFIEQSCSWDIRRSKPVEKQVRHTSDQDED